MVKTVWYTWWCTVVVPLSMWDVGHLDTYGNMGISCACWVDGSAGGLQNRCESRRGSILPSASRCSILYWVILVYYIIMALWLNGFRQQIANLFYVGSNPIGASRIEKRTKVITVVICYACKRELKPENENMTTDYQFDNAPVSYTHLTLPTKRIV